MVSGVLKLTDLRSFADTVANFKIVDAPWDHVVAFFLPWFEVVVGAALVLGVFSTGALVLFAGSLAVFTVAIGWVWSQGLNINCGCFGKSEIPTNYPLKVVVNSLLILIASWLWWQRVTSRLPIKSRVATA